MAIPGLGGLVGRQPECAVLDQVMAAVRHGESRVLVVHGEPGIGKSALLEHLTSSAESLLVLRAAGAEAEMELPFATLHQLCGPLLERLDDLPAPQRDTLATVFGLRAGVVPEGFQAGLGVLGLVTEASRHDPLLCVVDDADRMDRASAQVLGFVARRLPAQPVALVFAARRRSPDLIDLPELEVTGLGSTDAHALLDSATFCRLDQHIRDRLVAEARGNPRALLELPRELTVTELAGGFGLVKPGTAPSGAEQEFLTRIEQLPARSRLLLLVAAAEPVGDPTLVWRAAERLGVTPLEGDLGGLLSLDVRVIFRHPLVRTAAYRAAAEPERRAVHLALAEVTDASADPDRRAWHLASATAGPDDAVAAELERSAGRAEARSGLATAAAFLQRSVALTKDVSRRTERAVAAAEASVRAGDLAAARGLADVAELEAHDELLRGRAELVRGRVAHASGFEDASRVLLAAARRLEPVDAELARETYLLAWGAALSGDRDTLPAISLMIRDLPVPQRDSRPVDLVLTGCASLVVDRATSALRRALADVPAPDLVRWGWVACAASRALWDERVLIDLSSSAVRAVRAAGALAELPGHLDLLGVATAWTGDLATAAALADESAAVAAATGVHTDSLTWSLVKSLEGEENAGENELVEAVVRDCDTDWAQGMLARRRAVATDDGDLYREAIERLARTRVRPELARTHLLYGEWLRRRSRRVDARHQLRIAHEMFVVMGMAASAERTRRELAASGEKLQRRAPEGSPGDELTPQEKQIASLVRQGLSNAEVGARLHLSPRTVEWHLRNIFAKLSITSRRQVRTALPRSPG